MFDHSRLGLENKQTYSCIVFAFNTAELLYHNVAFTSLSNIAPFERLLIIGQPRNIILRNTRAARVLGGSQFTRCIPLSKRDAKIKNQAGLFVFDKFTLRKSWRRIWWHVNQPFKHTFSNHVSAGKQYYEALFHHTDLGQNLFFFPI